MQFFQEGILFCFSGRLCDFQNLEDCPVRIRIFIFLLAFGFCFQVIKASLHLPDPFFILADLLFREIQMSLKLRGDLVAQFLFKPFFFSLIRGCVVALTDGDQFLLDRKSVV